MKTNTYNFELVLPDQLNKEVFFNENLGMIDSLCNHVIHNFVDSTPSNEHKNKKFIISRGPNKNKICYATFPNKEWRYLTPSVGMTFFCFEKKNFTYFDGDEWVMQNVREDDIFPSRFESASDDFLVSNPFTYVYLNGRTKFIIENSGLKEINLIIKQNFSTIFDVNFNAPILWKDRAPYQSSRQTNRIDYLKLLKLPETSHYLCVSQSSGYIY